MLRRMAVGIAAGMLLAACAGPGAPSRTPVNEEERRAYHAAMPRDPYALACKRVAYSLGGYGLLTH